MSKLPWVNLHDPGELGSRLFPMALTCLVWPNRATPTHVRAVGNRRLPNSLRSWSLTQGKLDTG